MRAADYPLLVEILQLKLGALGSIGYFPTILCRLVTLIIPTHTVPPTGGATGAVCPGPQTVLNLLPFQIEKYDERGQLYSSGLHTSYLR